MITDLNNLKIRIQELLGKEIASISLLASGACNDAYLVETFLGHKYIVKRAKDAPEFRAQNSLVVEATVARKLASLNLSIPMPRVVFASNDPDMYGYEYIDGELMITVWPSLSEEQRVSICRKLGEFHAELGAKVTKEMACEMGVRVDDSTGLHPETVEEYASILASDDIPEWIKELAKRANAIFDGTSDSAVFHFVHNDAHHENILIRDAQIVGIIDFGETEYGEVAKEFSRYIRDFPKHFQYIVGSYEKASGNHLSRQRLITNSLLSGLIDNVEDYRAGGKKRERCEARWRRIKNSLDSF
ncbi:MAG: aminoglycoside phosphotransferase family protein [Patescibacteria group bacterium]